jgi:hypothetical protein
LSNEYENADGDISLHTGGLQSDPFGMQLLGEANAEEIPIVRDYSGRGSPRVIFWKAI